MISSCHDGDSDLPRNDFTTFGIPDQDLSICARPSASQIFAIRRPCKFTDRLNAWSAWLRLLRGTYRVMSVSCESRLLDPSISCEDCDFFDVSSVRKRV